MAGFSDLPEEVILKVAYHLTPRPESCSGPFPLWSSIVMDQIESCLSDRNSLCRLSSCNRYLFNLLQPTVHSYPILETANCMRSFHKALDTYPNLRLRVTDAYINYSHFSIDELYEILGLPNLHTITIFRFSGYQHSEFRDSMAGTSSVQVLRLIDCNLSDENSLPAPLLEIPARLKELWHDADANWWCKEFHRHGRRLRSISDACRCLEASLTTQKSSLERLVISRVSHDSTPVCTIGDFMQLHDFPNLKSFSIDYCDVLAGMTNPDIWQCLPPNLEELELEYANVKGPYASWEPTWLHCLLTGETRTRFVPSLRRVRILFLEWIEGPSPAGTADSHYLDDPTGAKKWAEREFWEPPSQVKRLFQEAGVSFSIYTDQMKQFKWVVDGEQDFEDPWEDTWTWTIPPVPRKPRYLYMLLGCD